MPSSCTLGMHVHITCKNKRGDVKALRRGIIDNKTTLLNPLLPNGFDACQNFVFKLRRDHGKHFLRATRQCVGRR